MVTMHETLPATKYWGILMDKRHIVAAGGVHYSVRRHPGTALQNIPLPEHDGIDMAHDLRRGKVPEYKHPHWPGLPLAARTDNIAFAIGSPFYTWTGEHNNGSYLSNSTWLRYLNYEREFSFKQLRESNTIRPIAMLLVDFDCQNSPINQHRIVRVMQEYYSRLPWALTRSDNSFHGTFEQPFHPNEFPIHFGRLIRAFAKTAPQYRRHIIEGFGAELEASRNNPTRLRQWSVDTLATFCHYDMSQPGKFPFIIDMKFGASVVSAHAKYLENQKEAFDLVRITPKTRGGSPPEVAVRNNPKKGLEYFRFSPGRRDYRALPLIV